MQLIHCSEMTTYVAIIILQTRMALLNLLHVIRTQFKKSRRGCSSTKQSSRSGTSEHLAVGTSSERHLPMTPTPGWRQTCLDSSEMVELMAGACKIDNKCIQFFDPEREGFEKLSCRLDSTRRWLCKVIRQVGIRRHFTRAES